jgi:DNA-binding phage protein
MPEVNLTEAAELAGLSRSYFHTNYIKTGIISVDRSDNKNPKIDTSEILRVFGKIKKNCSIEQAKEQVETPYENSSLFAENEKLKAVIDGLQALLLAKEEQVKREQHLTDKAEERAVASEQQYRALLEDRLSKPRSFLDWLKQKITP